MFHAAGAFDPAAGAELQEQVICYAREVISDGWPAMRRGTGSSVVDARVVAMDEAAEQLPVTGAKQAAAFEHWFALKPPTAEPLTSSSSAAFRRDRDLEELPDPLHRCPSEDDLRADCFLTSKATSHGLDHPWQHAQRVPRTEVNRLRRAYVSGTETERRNRQLAGKL